MLRWCLPFLVVTSCLLASTPSQVFVKGETFQAEVAETDAERAQGLMYRASLAKNACMFFVYEGDGQHPIWMKNCLISLDVMWVREDGSIVEMCENVPPCPPMQINDCATYGGKRVARHFIEFPAGTFHRLKLKVGDKVGWSLQRKQEGAMVGGAIPLCKAAKKRKS